ncbi:hypothetical protein ONZ43_g6583 [Nemania bipapillata]|uniref:Uncharacterized protein n=1 Tax=Nemania bipapillata TaxID=110536 RepID=A0ACC2HYP0_9PEZI|nr:hypothetical protein ONZ43_g6583 [Nemania bipapillata]
MAGLSYTEHARSRRPSVVLNAYLLGSLLLDVAIVRSFWLSGLESTICALFSASFALKAVVLVMEAVEKGRFIVDTNPGHRNPELTSGLYSRGLIWWMNPLLLDGFRRLLRPEDLYSLDGSMSADVLHKAFWRSWDEGPRSQKHMMSWIGKVQQRIGITSTMLGHMKSIKMSGMGQNLGRSIAQLRKDEIDAAAPFRIMSAIISAVAQAPVLLSPVAAFALFAIVSGNSGKSFDVTRVFTSLSLILLLGQPLFWILEAVLDTSAALASFKRIEQFISKASRTEKRDIVTQGPCSLNASGPADAASIAPSSHAHDFELQNLNIAINQQDINAIVVRNSSLSWSSEATPMLEIENMTVGKGELAIVIGAVACGKTTLLRGLLGELPSITGYVKLLGGKVAYCEQTPWLVNGTILQNIVGETSYDEALYSSVIHACDLGKDFAALDQGDQTIIGSKGIILSGGQRQRLALARLLYARPQLAFLDDPFSGLDNHTSQVVFNRTLSKQNGLLRQWGATVVLVTQAVKFLPDGDKVISLAGGSITEQGTFSSLRRAGGYVQGLFRKVSADEADDAVWLNWWTEANTKEPNSRIGYYLGVYATLQILAVISFGILTLIGIFSIASRVGIQMHQRLLDAVLRAPLSLFTSTDIGSITTRFSQDIGILDRSLPLALLVTIAKEKAPVYTQFLETLSGLVTIRAFGWSASAITTNHSLVDKSQRPFYLLLMVQQWLTLVLNLVTAALAVLIVGLAVRLRDSISASLTGVSLVQLITLAETLKLLIQFWTSLETSLGAVARIKNFSEETPNEKLPGENQQPPQNWPAHGHIDFRDISSSYGADEERKALANIDMKIDAGQKDTFYLPGSVRLNIDPYDSATSDAIERVLRRVGLWDVVVERGGLEAKFEDENLSHGQRQLFSLARAVLRKAHSRVIVFDEATSSVDAHTDSVIRDFLRDEFQHHTVIWIAHRLETILDFDRVIVLDGGSASCGMQGTDRIDESLYTLV